MVFRIYSEKRPEFSEAAESLANDIRDFLGVAGLERIRQAQLRYRNLDNAKNNVDMIMKLYQQYKAGHN